MNSKSTVSHTPPASIRAALVQGAQRVRKFWPQLLWSYGANVAMAVPLAAVIGTAIHDDLGASAAGLRMRDGFDPAWFAGFSAKHSGLIGSLNPDVSGIGAVLGGLDRLVTLSWTDLPLAILVAAAFYVVIRTLLSGGYIGLYAGINPGDGFWAHVGRNARRFTALLVIASALQLGASTLLLPRLNDLVDFLTAQVIDERIQFAHVCAKYAVLWGVFSCIRLVHEYARVTAVQRADLGLGGILLQTLSLARHHGPAMLGLFVALTSIQALCVVAYAVVAPGAGQSNWWTIGLAFVFAQLFVLVRVAMRCWSHAAATVYAAALRQ